MHDLNGNPAVPFPGEQLAQSNSLNFTYKLKWSNPTNEGNRNTLTKSQIRFFSDPAAKFTSGRLLAEVNSTDDFVNYELSRKGKEISLDFLTVYFFGLFNLPFLDISDCPRNLYADLVFHLNFLDASLLNSTMVWLQKIIGELVHVSPQAFGSKFEIFCENNYDQYIYSFFTRILYEPFKDTQIGFANFFQNDTNNLTDDYYKSAVYKFDRNFRPRSEKKLRVDLSEKYRDLNDKDNPRPKLRSGGSRPSVSFEI